MLRSLENANPIIFNSMIYPYRTFGVSRIKKTNLFLLVIESSCSKCKMDGKQDNDLPGIPGAAKENIFFNSIALLIFSFVIMPFSLIDLLSQT